MEAFAQNIADFNKQLSLDEVQFYNLAALKKSQKQPDAIIVCGMGGSGTVGDLLQNLAKNARISIPIISWKDYGLPDHPYKTPLYIFVSFSGGTQETISGFLKAKGLKGAISGGGRLTELAKKAGVALAGFNQNQLVPRQANGVMLYGALGLIKATMPGTYTPDFSKKIKPLAWEEAGRRLADRLAGKLILVYTASRHRPLGYFWKINFNETAKTPAFHNALPEMNHNEIVGFELKPENIAAIFLEDPDEDQIHQKRFAITDKILKKFGTKTLTVKLKGANDFAKTFNAMVLAEWTSYHLAQLHGVNPKATKIIEEIKKLI